MLSQTLEAHVIFAPSKVARKPFVFNSTRGRDFHLHWWAEGPCNTQHDMLRDFFPRPARLEAAQQFFSVEGTIRCILVLEEDKNPLIMLKQVVNRGGD